MKTFEQFLAEEGEGGCATTTSVGNTPGPEADAGFGKKPPAVKRRNSKPGQEDNLSVVTKSSHK